MYKVGLQIQKEKNKSVTIMFGRTFLKTWAIRIVVDNSLYFCGLSLYNGLTMLFFSVSEDAEDEMSRNNVLLMII